VPQDVLTVDVPLAPPSPTFYARFGDLFGWLAMGLSAMLIMWPLARRLRARIG
jgi:apolipoprotein N-acyltransferase